MAGRGHDRVADVGIHHLSRGLARERRPARQEGVGHAAQRVQVATPVDRPVAGDLLGGHVLRRAADGPLTARADLVPRGHDFDEAEVEQLDEVVPPAAPGGEDVRRLQVAVDQAGRMGLRQRLARLAQQVDDPAGRQRPVACRPARRGSARAGIP